MWLCTKYGFFSIVLKDDGFHIRARFKRDLVNLCEKCDIPATKIQKWPAADYRWRIVIESGLGTVFIVLASSIDYPNFKSEIATLPAQRAKLPAYHNFWADLATLQGS